MPYCDVGDAQLYYEVADYTDPWRPADTVVLHHPAMGNLTRWYAWVPALARDFRVVTFDVRGHGQSGPIPSGYQWSIEVLAQDVVRLLDHLGAGAVHYAGASAGGSVGLRYYLREHIGDSELVMLEGARHNISSYLADRCAREMMEFLARRGYVTRKHLE